MHSDKSCSLPESFVFHIFFFAFFHLLVFLFRLSLYHLYFSYIQFSSSFHCFSFNSFLFFSSCSLFCANVFWNVRKVFPEGHSYISDWPKSKFGGPSLDANRQIVFVTEKLSLAHDQWFRILFYFPCRFTYNFNLLFNDHTIVGSGHHLVIIIVPS